MLLPVAFLMLLVIRASFGEENVYNLFNETEFPIVNVSGLPSGIPYGSDSFATNLTTVGNCIGNDIDRKARISLRECAQLSIRTQGCVGAAYHPRLQKCWLKSSMENCHPRIDTLMTLHSNVDCEDHDIQKILYLDLTDCVRKCRETTNCSGVHYNLDQECFLKSGKGGCETKSSGLMVWLTQPVEHPAAPSRGYTCYDQPIGDANGFDLEACRTLCSSTTSCVAFSYNRATKRCWIMAGMTNCTSVEDPVVTVRPSYDCPENDVGSMRIPTLEECIDKCRKNPNCVGVTHNKRKTCYLKRTMVECETNDFGTSVFVA